METGVWIWGVFAIAPFFVGYLFATLSKHKSAHLFSIFVPIILLSLYLALELIFGQYDAFWPVVLLLGSIIVSISGYGGFFMGKWIYKETHPE